MIAKTLLRNDDLKTHLAIKILVSKVMVMTPSHSPKREMPLKLDDERSKKKVKLGLPDFK